MKALLTLAVLCLLAPAAGVGLLNVYERFPLQTLILATVLALSGICVFLYVGELVIIGWVVDFLSEIGMPAVQVRSLPLQCEQVGEILVVTLPDCIATIPECQSVQKQLNRLVDEQHCDFILDFHSVRNISRRFRGVMFHLMKAAAGRPQNSANPIARLLCRAGSLQGICRPETCGRSHVPARGTRMGCPVFSSRRNPGGFRRSLTQGGSNSKDFWTGMDAQAAL